MFSLSAESSAVQGDPGVSTSVGLGSRDLDDVADKVDSHAMSSSCGNSNFTTRSRTFVHLNNIMNTQLQLQINTQYSTSHYISKR